MFFFYAGPVVVASSEAINRCALTQRIINVLALCVFAVFSILFVFFDNHSPVVDIMAAISGVFSIWLFFDSSILAKMCSTNLPAFISFTFFVYLYHDPLIIIIKKVIVFVLGKNVMGYTLGYLFAPPVVFLILYTIGRFAKERFRYYGLLVGGR